MVKTMVKLHMAHASTHGACKPPGPITKDEKYAETVKGNASYSTRMKTIC